MKPAHLWPHDGERLGYTPQYFKELANEVRRPHRPLRGGPVQLVWEPRSPSSAVRVEAWDARVYALAALYVQAFPGRLEDYLLRLHRDRAKRLGGNVVAVAPGIAAIVPPHAPAIQAFSNGDIAHARHRCRRVRCGARDEG